MGDFLSAVRDYLWVVFFNRWAAMFALLVSIDEFMEWMVPRYRARLNRRFSQETRRKAFLVALLVFVFVAGFLAWKDENADRLASENRLSDAQKKIASLEAQPRIGEEAKAQIDSLTQTNQQLQQKVTALEQQSLPRTLTDEQREKLTEALSKVPLVRIYRLLFIGLPNCEECSDYMGELVNIWNKAPGWRTGGTISSSLPPRATGLFIAVGRKGCSSEELHLVTSALDAAGIQYEQGQTNVSLGPSDIPGCRALVGRKPQQ